jgi:hypothetical protein
MLATFASTWWRWSSPSREDNSLYPRLLGQQRRRGHGGSTGRVTIAERLSQYPNGTGDQGLTPGTESAPGLAVTCCRTNALRTRRTMRIPEHVHGRAVMRL